LKVVDDTAQRGAASVGKACAIADVAAPEMPVASAATPLSQRYILRL
jgi:hypothetical protein